MELRWGESLGMTSLISGALSKDYVTFDDGDYTDWQAQFNRLWQDPQFRRKWQQMQSSDDDFHYAPGSVPDHVTSITGSSNLRLDDDGSGGRHLDPDHQSHTSWRPNGRDLNADSEEYAVSPLGTEGFGVRGGDPATVSANGHVQNAPVGDFGPASNGFGEVSLALGHVLGVPCQDVPGIGPVIPGPAVPVAVTVYPSHPITLGH